MEHKKNTAKTVIANVTIGLQVGITIFIFVYAGHWLDQHYGKSPVFLILGTFLGFAIGFYHLYKELMDLKKREDAEKENKSIRKKWN